MEKLPNFVNAEVTDATTGQPTYVLGKEAVNALYEAWHPKASADAASVDEDEVSVFNIQEFITLQNHPEIAKASFAQCPFGARTAAASGHHSAFVMFQPISSVAP